MAKVPGALGWQHVHRIHGQAVVVRYRFLGINILFVRLSGGDNFSIYILQIKPLPLDRVSQRVNKMKRFFVNFYAPLNLE